MLWRGYHQEKETMGEAEGREETHEAGRTDRSSARGFSGVVENQGLIQEKLEPKRKSVVREYAEAIIIAVVLALFIRTFVVQAFKIPSGSMKQTLKVGDHILVNKFLYGIKIPFTDRKFLPFRGPEYLDIVVFKFPEDETKDFIKRVIGLPGDTIEVKRKVVFRNGKPLTEPYTIYTQPYNHNMSVEKRDEFGPVVVPEDSYFMMGDLPSSGIVLFG